LDHVARDLRIGPLVNERQTNVDIIGDTQCSCDPAWRPFRCVFCI
jgi:hypothetical protein